MFARQAFGNPYQQFTGGLSPAIGQFGMIPAAQLTNPLIAAQLASLTPSLPPQIGGYGVSPYGVNPYAAGAMPGGAPVLQQSFAPGVIPPINPQVLSLLATLNPSILANLAPQMLGGGPGTQIPSVPGIPQINPLLQQIGNEASYFGYTPFGIQTGWGNMGQLPVPLNPVATMLGQPIPGINPYQAFNPNVFSPSPQDQVFGASQAQQQRLPIRPLVSPQPIDPYQAGFLAGGGVPGNPLTDPYSAFTQAHLLGQFGVNPAQQMSRAYTLSNWAASPYSTGQFSPFLQTGTAHSV